MSARATTPASPSPAAPSLLTPGVVRRMAGWSQMRVAVEANVGVGTVRIYEIDPREVLDSVKRRGLAHVYARLRDEVVKL